jgi:hypothetical protein
LPRTRFRSATCYCHHKWSAVQSCPTVRRAIGVRVCHSVVASMIVPNFIQHCVVQWFHRLVPRSDGCETHGVVAAENGATRLCVAMLLICSVPPSCGIRFS